MPTLKANLGNEDVYTLPLLYYVKKDTAQQTLFCFIHFVPTVPSFVLVFFVFVRKVVGFNPSTALNAVRTRILYNV